MGTPLRFDEERLDAVIEKRVKLVTVEIRRFDVCPKNYCAKY